MILLYVAVAWAIEASPSKVLSAFVVALAGIVGAVLLIAALLIELPANIKMVALMGEFASNEYGGLYYAKAMNLSRQLTAAYDQALRIYDVLLLPTVPLKPTLLPLAGADAETVVMRALEVSGNTAPFNLTRHPALSVPCGMMDGLPIGMMLVGRHLEEATIYRAAYAFEQSYDWRHL